MKQRPDDHRTRQLIRKSIIEGKKNSTDPIEPSSQYIVDESSFEDVEDYTYGVSPEQFAEVAQVPVQPRRKPKKKHPTRRKLLIWLGIAAGGGVAAYKVAPHIPQAAHDVGTNIEKELQDAFLKGAASGANEARKEIITALDNLEGYSLEAAINAAKLTRLAYDAFVVPLVTLAATVTGDFLNATLLALKNARGFLAKFNQDSDTLAALQVVLETWIKQVHEVPKEIQSITASDLDGAQSYLHGLRHKLDEEKAKLNGSKPK